MAFSGTNKEQPAGGGHQHACSHFTKNIRDSVEQRGESTLKGMLSRVAMGMRLSTDLEAAMMEELRPP